MAKVGVRIKLNVSQIEKARLFKGLKGVYLDATAFIDLDEKGQYGDNGMVTQDVSKEEREAGTKGPILGNVTVFFRDDQPQQNQGGRQGYQQPPQNNGYQQQPQNQPPQNNQQQNQPPQNQQPQQNYGAPDPGQFDDFSDEIPFN